MNNIFRYPHFAYISTHVALLFWHCDLRCFVFSFQKKIDDSQSIGSTSDSGRGGSDDEVHSQRPSHPTGNLAGCDTVYSWLSLSRPSPARSVLAEFTPESLEVPDSNWIAISRSFPMRSVIAEFTPESLDVPDSNWIAISRSFPVSSRENDITTERPEVPDWGCNRAFSVHLPMNWVYDGNTRGTRLNPSRMVV